MPSLLAQAFEMIVESGLRSPAEIITELALPPSDLEALAGLQPGFLTAGSEAPAESAAAGAAAGHPRSSVPPSAHPADLSRPRAPGGAAAEPSPTSAPSTGLRGAAVRHSAANRTRHRPPIRPDGDPPPTDRAGCPVDHVLPHLPAPMMPGPAHPRRCSDQ